MRFDILQTKGMLICVGALLVDDSLSFNAALGTRSHVTISVQHRRHVAMSYVWLLT